MIPNAAAAAACYNQFASISIASPQSGGVAFSVTLTLQKGSNPAPSCASGTVTLSTGAGTISPTSIGSFVGSATFSVTMSGVGIGRTFNVSGNDVSGNNASITQQSGSFQILAGPLDHISWNATVPNIGADSGTVTLLASPRDSVDDARADPITYASSAPGVGTIGASSGIFTPTGAVGSTTITATSGAKSATTTINVTAGALDHVTFTTHPSSVTAGGTATFVASGFDAHNNAWGAGVNYSVTSGPGSITSGGAYSSTSLGTATVHAAITNASSSVTKSADATITVNAGATSQLVFTSPSSSTGNADTPVTFTAVAEDSLGNPTGATPTYNLQSGSGFLTPTSGAFTPWKVGSVTVRASAGSVTNDFVYSVTVGALHYVNYSAAPGTTSANVPVTFTASTFDNEGNARSGDPIAYSVASGGGSIHPSSGLFTPGAAGSTVIRATSGAVHGDATIVVTVGPLDHVVFTAAPTSTTADATATFTARGVDVRGNARADPVTYSLDAGSGAIGASTGVYAPNLVGVTVVRATATDGANATSKSQTASITVSAGALDHVAFTTSPSTTDADTNQTFVAQAYDSHGNARNDSIAYSIASGSGSVGSASGLFTPNLAGTTTLMAAAGAKSATAAINVTPGALASVAFTAAPTSTDADTPVAFAAHGYDAHGNQRGDAITYSVLSGSGSVSASGVYTPDQAGNATIRATDAAQHADAGIRVSAGALDHVAFTSAPASTDADTPATFVAHAYDAHGNLRSDSITYSLDSGPGSIGSASGTYTPSLVGAAIVRATAGGTSATATITVSPGGLDHVAFTSAPTTTDAVTQATFAAHAYDAHGNLRNDSIVYSIASGSGSVDASTGVFTPSLVGSTTIHAAAGGKSADAAILVTPGALDHITISPPTASLQAGGSQAFTAAGYDREGNGVAIAPTWSTSCGSMDASGGYSAPHALATCDVNASSGSIVGSATASIIDTVAPATSASASCSLAGDNGWCRGNVTFSGAASDSGTGLAPGSPACTLDAAPVDCSGSTASPGSHTFALSATDNAGNANASSASFQIDRDPPTATLDASCATPGTTGWCRAASYGYAGASSDATSGLAASQPTCTLDGASAPCSGNVSGEGPHLLTLATRDAAGNTNATSLALAIDSAAPQLALSTSCAMPGTLGWCRSSSYAYSASASDATSGLAAGEPTCTLDGAAAPCAGTVSGEGPHTLAIHAADPAGNANSTSVTLAIDSVAPTLNASASCASPGSTGWCLSSSYGANASASDATSGLATLACTLDGAPSACDVTVAGEGPHAFAATASDAAGNEASASLGLAIDSVAPNATLSPACATPGAPGWCRASSYAYASSASDATSGLAAPAACTVDGDPAPCNGTVSGEGHHAVALSVSDLAGHTTTRSFDLGIDSIAPSATLVADCSILGEAGWCRSASYAYDGASLDATSGVATGAPACTLDGADAPCHGTVSGEGPHALTLTTSDAAGNLNATTLSLAVDSVPPDVALAITCLTPGNPGWCLDASYGYAGNASDGGSGLAAAQPACLLDGASAPCSGTVTTQGAHTIVLLANDSAGNSNATSASLGIDSVPPALDRVADQTLEATGPLGATANYTTPNATDATSGVAGPVLCDHASGATYTLASTIVGCSASDAAGNAGFASFTITVRDTTPPVIAAHGDATAEAANASGAMVTFASPDTSDLVDGDGTATCAPASGSLFPLGNTTVSCSAQDAAGNPAASTTFVVRVVDSTPPVIAPRGDITMEATSSAGAIVSYSSPATTDAVDGAGAATCLPASGSTFALHDTIVTCDATDAHGNHAIPSAFVVHVVDTTPPVIAPHGDESAEAAGAAGAIVDYAAPPWTDAVDGSGDATCAPASGSLFHLGSTTVACDATDAAGNHANQTTFTVRVVDSTPPVIAPHADATAEAANASGAVVSYASPTTNDIVDGAGTAICLPASGSLFPLGDDVVACDGTDAAGNHANETTFTIHVVDSAAPVIAPHADVTHEADNASGAIVDYAAPTWTDAVDGTGTASCAPASGSLFPRNDSLVTCTQTDAHGNAANATTFTVHVVDTTPPTIDAHANVDAEATSAAGAAVAFGSPATHDAVDGAGIASCSPPSGSTFALGHTTVWCNATDSSGNAAGTRFDVWIHDLTPPVIDAHADVEAEAQSGAGANVTFDAPAWHDAVDGSGNATCAPASGSLFALGNTTIACSVTDAHGNLAVQTQFQVSVEDHTPPVIAPHASVSAEATGPTGALVTFDAPATSDLVDGAGTATCAPASGSLFAVGNTTVTCDATDARGNAAASTSFLVTVTDTTAPVIDAHADETHEAANASGVVVDYAAPAAHDAVDGAFNATCSPATGALFPLGNTTVTCDAQDAAGNHANETSFTIHVVDTTAPTIDAHPDVEAEAESAAGANVTYAAPATHDAVDGDGNATCAPASGSLFALGNTTVTCTATDAHGNPAASTTFRVSVEDHTAPVIAPHADETREATGSSGAVVTYAAPSTSDAVDGPGAATCAPASGSTFAITTTIVTCGATDAAGNAALPTTFQVIVQDTTAPTIDAHAPETREATGPSGAIVTYAPPAWHDVVDGVGNASCSPASGSTFALGDTSVTCHATDAHGNAANATTFTLTITDTTAPTIDAHADIIAEATSAAGAVVTFDPPNASDLVSGALAVTCIPTSGSLDALGHTTVTCTASDAQGNHNATSFDVLVHDTTAPTIDAHAPEAREATGPSGAIVNYSAPAWHDAVDGAGNATCAPASGSTFSLGNTTVTCGVTDRAGNAATPLAFNVSVVDTTPPTIDAHANVTTEATSPSGAAVAYAAPATHDVVDGLGAASCTPASGMTFPLGDTTVLCDATDAAGNAANGTSFTITVTDHTPPVIAAHADVIEEATGASGALVGYASPTTSDIVDGNGTPTCAPAGGSLFGLGNTTVTCAATDAHGNAAAATFFVVRVRDTTPPTIDAVADIIAEATDGAGADASYASPATSDLVDGASTATCAPPSGTHFALGITNVTCTASDAAGNAATPIVFRVTVQDSTPPAIAPHANVTAEATSGAGALVTYASPTTSDLVDGAGTARCAPASGSPFPLGNTTVSCSATDAHGNSASSSFLVTVRDSTPPAIDAHADAIAEATGPSGASVTYAPPATHDAVDGDGTATCAPASGSVFPLGNDTVTCGATDAAGNAATPTAFTIHVRDTTPPLVAPHIDITAEAQSAAGAVVDYAAGSASDLVDGALAATCLPASNGTFPLGATIVTCAATDAHGNTGSSAFTITVRDTTPPTIDAHGDIAAEATGAAGASVTYAPPATHDAVDGLGAASCWPASGSTFALGSTHVTCSASDAHGNAAAPTSFTVNVLDTTPPTLDANATVTAEATNASGASVTYARLAWSDLVDGNGTATCAPASGSLFALGTTIVGCTATDAHGNSASGHVTIVVRDTTAPTLSLPADITKEATGPSGASATWIASASDAVDGTDAVSCAPASGSTFALGTTTVLCRATDANGNLASGSFHVTVRDTTPPTLTLPGNITVNATGLYGAYVNYSAGAIDGVDGSFTMSVGSAPSTPDLVTCTPASGGAFAFGATTVSCSATDAHGNVATGSFQVMVRNTLPPTLALPPGIRAVASSVNGTAVTFVASAHDVFGVPITPTCAPASGSRFAPGATIVSCSARDARGNVAIGSFTVTVGFAWSGPLAPLVQNATIRNAGSTLPVKFQLTGASAGIQNLTARLYVSSYPGGVESLATPQGGTSAAFRYDPTSGQYVFNWATKGLLGAWKLRIDLGDGSTNTAIVTLV